MPRTSPKTPAGTPARPPNDAARRFLELYYPIHYKAGIGVEDALRGGELGRHQVAILWLIHSEGEDGRAMNRKAIERSLRQWFEVSGAAITKAIRSMSAAPLELVRLEEDPRSGREKIVRLTPRGEAHIEAMIARGTAYVQRIIDHMDAAEIVSGLAFFRSIERIVDSFED